MVVAPAGKPGRGWIAPNSWNRRRSVFSPLSVAGLRDKAIQTEKVALSTSSCSFRHILQDLALQPIARLGEIGDHRLRSRYRLEMWNRTMPLRCTARAIYAKRFVG
jgi:hypothetical protein